MQKHNKYSKHTKRALTLLVFVAALTLIMSSIAFNGIAAAQPTIWTNKQVYTPGETVQIYGSGLAAGTYDIPVIRPDGTIVKGDGTFTPGWDSVSTATGNLAYSYKLDGITGDYEARLYVSPWNGDRSLIPIASVIFNDPPPKADLDQGRNGAFDDPTDPVDWVNGNIGAQQGHYVEGYSIPYRVYMTDVPTGVNVRLIIEYDTKHSDAHAIDYLTHFDRIDTPFSHQDVFGHPPETIDPLINATGVPSTFSTFPIPTPSNNDAHIPTQPSTSFLSLPAAERVMTLFGGTITGMAYVVQQNETGQNIASTSIAVNFTLTSTNAVLAWGGHIGSRLDWGFDPDGTPHSAGGISGSPYHMRLINWTTFPADPRDDLPNLGNTDRSLSAVAVFAPPVPGIFLTKTASAPKVLNTTQVTFTYNVTNTGDTDFAAMNITDNIYGLIAPNQTLAVNETKTFTITRTLNQTTTNTATAFGTIGTGATVNATATTTVVVIHPALSLTKTPSSTKVENGSSVTYTYNVTNTGDTSLTVNLTDNTFGTIFTGKVMAPGESNITTITQMLTQNTTNIATANGVDQLGTNVTATATATVTVLHPAITVTKTASAPKVESGTLVNYTYVVTNTGDTPLTVNLTDSVFASPIFINKLLGPGQSNTTVVGHVLTANTTNVATATGIDQLGTTVQNTDSETVRVINPNISLTKTPSATKVENGATVTYTYNITNIGDVPLSGNLTDDVFGGVGSFFNLPAGNSVLFTVPHVLTVNTTNTATVFVVDQLGKIINASATAFVQVIHPNLTVTKTPSVSKALNTTSITFTYNVTNTGDTALTVNLTDNVYGTLFTNKVLAPGDFNVTTIVRTLNQTTTNTATATGTDQLGATVTRTASATVTIIHPTISITKTCSPEDQLAPGNITWVVIVRNIGDVPLTNINITESRPTLINFTFPGPLAVGGTITITQNEYFLPPGTYYNNASVIAAQQLGTVSAWDDTNCTIRAVFILKQFVNVTVLPVGISEGFNATLVNSTLVNINGTKTGPKVYFTIQYYFENSLNFLGSSFDGQAHNFTLWDKWGGNLLSLGSPPVNFSQTTSGPNANRIWLADNSTFRIDPSLTGADSYRGYIGSGLNISNLASCGTAYITMHTGDQQNGTNPGKGGKGNGNDGKSYDTDTVWYMGQVGVNQSCTLTLYIAPGKNPGGQLEFTSLGCTVINTGPRVRAYGNSYNNEDFLYAVERTNTLQVCVFPKLS